MTLKAPGHIARFFVVSKHLGTARAGGVTLDETGVSNLRADVDAGHVVANGAALGSIFPPESHLPFSCAPGNSWSPATARNLALDNVTARSYRSIA